MKMTEDNVFRVEHQLIKDLLLWELMDDDRMCHTAAAYVCGVNDMATAMVECLKDFLGGGDDHA